MFGTRIAALVACLALLCTGCAGNREYGQAPGVVVTQLSELPMSARGSIFTLRPLDSVEIRVVPDSDLSGTYFVDERGILLFPYVGEVQAQGRTPSEVAETIRAGLDGGYLVDPDVVLRPTGERGVPTVSLGGQVDQPGEFPITSATSLLRAVNLAGGTSEFAQKDDVLIFREVEGQRYIGAYNLAAIERGNYPDPPLAANDIVMVGESAFARRFSTIFQFLPLLTTAVILLDQTGVTQ